jgi:hypothetical protein
MQTAFPTPEDDDVEDVAWGLTTGGALWRQGERYDAIVWLKRAVEAANEAGAAGRADQLNRAATDLIALLAAPPQVAPRRAPPVSRPGSSPGFPPPRVPSNPSFSKQQLAGAGAAPLPVPPRPPPPPRMKTPPAQPAITVPQAVPSEEPTKPRAPLPSVTTSAPTLEALTTPAAGAAEETAPRESPPPPTILPDLPSSMPTPHAPLDPIDAAQSDAPPNPAIDAPPPKPLTPVPPPIELTSPDDLPRAPGAALEGEASATADEPLLVPSLEATAPKSALVAALDALPLTDEQRRALAATATIESLAGEEDISVACLALVLEGSASVQATVADVVAVPLNPGQLLYAKSSIPDALSLRLVAEAEPTVVAVWDHAADAVIEATPDLAERLMQASDRIQAIAGCTMGPVGDRLDEGLRTLAIDRLDVRVLGANEVIATAGQAVPGMVIVGVGVVEIEGDNGESDRLGPGDFLFATEVLGGGSAPATARAGAKGAIVLFGARDVAHELLVTCPPLLEVFAGM